MNLSTSIAYYDLKKIKITTRNRNEHFNVQTVQAVMKRFPEINFLKTLCFKKMQWGSL